MRLKGWVLYCVILAFALVGLSCGGGAKPESADTAGSDVQSKAEKLAKESIIIDTHVDVPYRLQEKMEDISVRTADGNFDYPRAKEGGLDAPFMSIYIPASYQKTAGSSKSLAEELIAMVEKFQTDWPDKFAVAKSPQEVRDNFSKGLISLPMGMENGAGIEDDLANVAYFRDRGISYITLTHSKSNQICDSSYDPNHQWNGLSPFGREVVAEMNRVGIMVDVSHISDDAFYQVMDLSKAPAIASHSSCRRFTPGWERNMDDKMIQLLAEKGGVIQINFGSTFLKEDLRKKSDAARKEVEQYFKDHNITEDSAEAKEYIERYQKDHPQEYADVSDVADHIDHVVKLAGIDHVGLGSDFDGVGDSLPTGLKDVSQYPNLIAELVKRGYSDEDIKKICGENLLRVWTEVQRIAGEMQAAGSETHS